MTGAERGFLLLCSCLGNPDRRVLTAAQMRILSGRVRQGEKTEQDRDLGLEDLTALGYGAEMAERILRLLQEEELLAYYCRKGEQADCLPLTRISTAYPRELSARLADEAPGCLWCKGDITLLERPKVSLVGSRNLLEQNREFAAEVGKQAAKQGYVLVSGNARGADKTAQDACLDAGGSVISVVADRLREKPLRQGLLYISEEDYDADFSAQRAISRNRVIHALGEITFVAQSGYQTGGTWDGTVKNLRFGWSTVCCFDDGSPAAALLQQMGAEPIDLPQLIDFAKLPRRQAGFL